jgi:hypothetical protein
MPLPVLTWAQTPASLITVGVPTYQEFLDKVESVINASTYWKVSKKTLDAGNSRGYVEIAPKSALAGVTEGRVMLMFSTGTVSGAAGSERPLQACRNAPWATATTSLACKMWAGVSDNANTADGVGPANDPWTSATPYGASNWSKLFPLNATIPAANATIGLIESAEVFALYWTTSAGSEIEYLISGRGLEYDDNTAYWMIGGIGGPDTTASATGWNTILGLATPPIGACAVQNSTGTSTRAWTAALIGGNLYGIGRNFQTVDTSGVNAGFLSLTRARFAAIPLCGGIYTAGSNDADLGTFRQVRWGPPAYRGQILTDTGVTQGIHLNYAPASTGAKPWGLWFDNFRE